MFARWWFGLAFGSIVAAVAASWLFDGDAATPSSLGLPVSVLGVLGVGAVALAFRRDGSASGRRTGARGTWVVAGIAAALTVTAAVLFGRDVGRGTPGPVLAVLALCGLVLTISLLLSVRGRDRAPSDGDRSNRPQATQVTEARSDAPGRDAAVASNPLQAAQVTTGRPGSPARGESAGPNRLWAPPVTAVLTCAALLAAGAGAAPTLRDLPARSTTASPQEAAPIPPVPRNTLWHNDDTDRGIGIVKNALVPAGTGFATVLEYPGAPDRGAAGVDAATGKVRWSYELRGANAFQVYASPDGAVVAVPFSAGGGRDTRATRVVFLDGFTGEVLAQRVLAGESGLFTMTDETLVVAGADGEALGIDARTGEDRWRWRPPTECEYMFALPAATHEVALRTVRCDGDAVVHAVDQRTGKIAWTYELPLPSERVSFDPYLATSPHSDVIAFFTLGSVALPTVLLDAHTGRALQELPPNTYVYVTGPVPVIGGDARQYWDPRLQTIREVTWPADCPNVAQAAATPEAIVVTCVDDSNTSTKGVLVQPLSDEPAFRAGSGRSSTVTTVPGGVLVVGPDGFDVVG